ncbi:protein trichome birefringence-like 2 [Rosa rugosa]|uniref:protein trichome birefringence-like 2 n=1 Tax=Rosa rugosa TaxID=74645 RepID=UPI002B41824E|nr:protein trichome birefringence-like 2 [Rosa rugosa]
MHALSSAMVLKKLEQFFSPKRNLISGFVLGIGVSLIVLIFVSNSLKSSSPTPTVEEQGFYIVSVNSSFVSTTAHSIAPELQSSTGESNESVIALIDEKFVEGNENGTMVFEKAQLGNITEEVDDRISFWVEEEGVQLKDDSFDSYGEGSVLGIAQLGNVTEQVKGESLGIEEGSVRQKDGNFDSNGEGGIAHLGNSSQILEFGRLHGAGGKATGKSSVAGKEENVEACLKNNSRSGNGMVTEDVKNEIIGFDSQTWEMQSDDDSDQKCDIYDGKWVRDDSMPYYPGGSCPHIDRDFNCHLNRRPDDEFLKWKWQPYGCDISSLNATDFLERLRGKRLVFVGDSLNRNMWESLVCILRHTVRHKNRVYELSGKSQFKKRGIYSFKFEEYDCFVEYVGSPFLVRQSSFAGKETLRLDLMDQTTSKYRDADIIVFNTAHWWNYWKTARGLHYYQEGNYVHPRLKALEAYKRALTTWARWVDMNINPNRTRVFFRGYAYTHYSNGQWNSGGHCHKETEPIFNEAHLSKYPSKMRTVESVLQGMKTPVTYLNISRLTDYRKDAHPSIYRMEYKTKEEEIAAERSQDCNHWCLPGVPDTWNELLYASLLKDGWESGQK